MPFSVFDGGEECVDTHSLSLVLDGKCYFNVVEALVEQVVLVSVILFDYVFMEKLIELLVLFILIPLYNLITLFLELKSGLEKGVFFVYAYPLRLHGGT